jgi:hypothetical protein
MPTYLLIPRDPVADISRNAPISPRKPVLRVRLVILPALWEHEPEQILLPTGQLFDQQDFLTLRRQLGAWIATDDAPRICRLLRLLEDECGVRSLDSIPPDRDVLEGGLPQ